MAVVGNSISANRSCEVGGRPIRVYDGLLSQRAVSNLTMAIERGAFTRSEIARPDTGDVRHWALNIPLDAVRQLPVYLPTLDVVRKFEHGESYWMYRSYCNYSGFGDMLFTHTDTQQNVAGLTALWYVTPEWNVEWGGETLFFNADMDAEVVVSPKPGRLVVFDGTITHAGRPPNRICHAPRYTLALKWKGPD